MRSIQIDYLCDVFFHCEISMRFIFCEVTLAFGWLKKCARFVICDNPKIKPSRFIDVCEASHELQRSRMLFDFFLSCLTSPATREDIICYKLLLGFFPLCMWINVQFYYVNFFLLFVFNLLLVVCPISILLSIYTHYFDSWHFSRAPCSSFSRSTISYQFEQAEKTQMKTSTEHKRRTAKKNWNKNKIQWIFDKYSILVYWSTQQRHETEIIERRSIGLFLFCFNYTRFACFRPISSLWISYLFTYFTWTGISYWSYVHCESR